MITYGNNLFHYINKKDVSESKCTDSNPSNNLNCKLFVKS